MGKTFLQVEAITSEALVSELEKRFTKIIDSKIAKLFQPSDEDKYLSRQDVANMLGVTLVSIHRLMKAGILKPHKFGHTTRFLLSEVKAAAISTGRKMEAANA